MKKPPPPPKGLAALHPIRRAEIARQGGHALFAKRGRDHMARIGRRGGKAGAKP